MRVYTQQVDDVVKKGKETVVENENEIDSDENLQDQSSSSIKPQPQIRLPFPARIEKSKEDKLYAKFLENMKDVQITIPVLKAVLHVHMYAKFFKELLTKKNSIDEPEIVTLTKECGAVI